jgi:hypothetical protein
VEIDQVYKAPSIPKLNRRNIKSTLISGAIKPGVELKKTKFSFIKPLAKLIPDSLIPDKSDENKREGLVKYIQSNFGIQKVLEQSNKLLSQIKEQLSLDFLSRIREEKKDLEESKKRIAAEKVKDKEKKLESGGVKGFLGKTFSTLLAPAKSIFQKLIDFFSIILTGILVNTAFKWLQKPENQEKLKQFFQFLKDYWKELLVVFGAIKLLGLVRKVLKVANALKSLIDFFKKKPQLPCNCPKSPAQKGGLPDCEPIKDCVDSLVKDPKKGPGFLENLAQSLLGTKAFAPFLLLLGKPLQTPQPKAQQPGQQPTPFIPISPKPPSSPSPPAPPSPPAQTPTTAANKRVPFTRTPTATPTKTPTSSGAFRSGIPMGTRSGLFSILGGFALGQAEQERVKNKVSQLQQLKTSNPKEYKKQLNQLRNEAKSQKYLNIINEITGSPSIPTAYILKALGELKQDEIPKSINNIGYNPNKLTPDLNKDGTPVISQSNASKENIERIIREKNPTFNQKQIINATTTSLKLIQRGVAVTQAIIQATASVATAGVERSKGGTIPKISLFAGGGTVGGPGALGVDSVPAAIASGAGKLANYGKALLAPGEEVINTRASMLFRPLLKDINDNAARMWQSFTNAVRRQDAVNSIKSGIIEELNKILEEFKALLDKESTEIKRKKRTGGATGGGVFRPSLGGSNPIQKIDKGVGGLIKDVGGMIGRNQGKQTRIPGGGFVGEQLGRNEAESRYEDFKNSIRELMNRSRSNISRPNINVQNPINLTQNIVNPEIEKTILGNQNVYVIPVPISRETSKLSGSKSSGGNISVINLPPKTLNLNKPKSKPLPSSPSGTTVPSISPIDQSNDYVFTTPSMYGILVV